MCSEFDLIHRYFKKSHTDAILGIGDDAALIANTPGCELALSTDTLVSGRHFCGYRSYQLGYKSLAVNLSDMAAMGAKPRWAMLSLTLPEDLAKHPSWLANSAKVFVLADKYRVQLIGGDDCRSLGYLRANVGDVSAGKRCGSAKPGDDIWVSGQIGSAAVALQHECRQIILESDEFTQCLPALLAPVAQVELGQHLIGGAQRHRYFRWLAGGLGTYSRKFRPPLVSIWMRCHARPH